jgi:hypothetical protein
MQFDDKEGGIRAEVVHVPTRQDFNSGKTPRVNTLTCPTLS